MLSSTRLTASTLRGRTPTVEELARVGGMNIDKEEIKNLARIVRPPLSLDHAQADEEISFGEMLPDSSVEQPSLSADRAMLKERIAQILRSLTTREGDIIRMRFGLTGNPPKTLEECAHVYGVTRERIRQIEARAMRKLKSPDRSERLVGFLEPAEEGAA